MPSWSQIEGQVRGVLMTIAGIAATFGYLSESNVTAIVGVVMAVAGALWSVFVNRKTALVKAVEAIPEVKTVTLDRSAASQAINAATGNKVSVS